MHLALCMWQNIIILFKMQPFFSFLLPKMLHPARIVFFELVQLFLKICETCRFLKMVENSPKHDYLLNLFSLKTMPNGMEFLRYGKESIPFGVCYKSLYVGELWISLHCYHKMLVRVECMRTNVVRVLADVVATKLGIILPFFSLFFLLSFLPLTFLPEGVCLWIWIFACISK